MINVVTLVIIIGLIIITAIALAIHGLRKDYREGTLDGWAFAVRGLAIPIVAMSTILAVLPMSTDIENGVKHEVESTEYIDENTALVKTTDDIEVKVGNAIRSNETYLLTGARKVYISWTGIKVYTEDVNVLFLNE